MFFSKKTPISVLCVLLLLSIILCISVAWTVIYNVAGTKLLNKCDVY